MASPLQPVNANPISDTYAISAAEDILETLPALIHNASDIMLRERMAMPGALIISAYDSATVRVMPSGEVTIHQEPLSREIALTDPVSSALQAA